MPFLFSPYTYSGQMGEGGEEKREGAPELGFGFGFPHKLIRTGESPFRMASAAAPLSTPNGTAGPFLLYSDDAAVYDARELEPLAASAVARAFHPSPLAAGAFRSAAALLRYPQFTPAQWQELHRQALIYKYLASSVPVPDDLLFESVALPALPLLSAAAGGGGAGGYYGVRFTGADSADPEPGRCRRTDGKKWRCARDAVPEQKYCERHMHRGRPRSKPVEPAPKTAGSASTGVSPAGTGAPLPRPGVIKLPFLSIAPEKDTRYMNWVDVRIEGMQPNNSDGGFPRSYQGGRRNHAGSSCSDLNDPGSYSFLDPELDNTRRFIDAWSTESLSVPPADPEPALREKTCSTNRLPCSALTLSMSGSGEDHEGAEGVQMGVSTPGGPLGEVLRPSNVVSPSGGTCSCGGGSLASLVGKGSSGSGSTRESPPRVLLSSPTGVLQRTLVSLSDSSCNSGPSFAAVAAAGSGDGRSEATGLPWTSANAKKW